MEPVSPSDDVPLPAEPLSGRLPSAEASAVEPPAIPPLPDLAEAIPPPLPDPPSMPRVVGFEFHGQAREYFRIFIVNVLLTLATLGVFSAWAKVRKRRYLRGNTTLLGHAFHYTAEPWRLLVGNVFMVLLFLGYSFFGAVYPVVRFGTLAVGALLLPWIVVRSLSFNAFHTLHRGLRLRFRGTLGEATLIYLMLPILVVLSLGFYYPAWQRQLRAYTVRNHRFGLAQASFHGKTGAYFRPMFFGFLIVIVGAMLGGAIVGFWTATIGAPLPPTFMIAITLTCYGCGFFTGRHFTYPRIFNHAWSSTRLGEMTFVATMSPGAWMKLQWVNLLAIIGTAGLALPWATMRTAKYQLSCLALQIPKTTDLDKIERMGIGDGSAIGDSAAEFVGLDFGL